MKPVGELWIVLFPASIMVYGLELVFKGRDLSDWNCQTFHFSWFSCLFYGSEGREQMETNHRSFKVIQKDQEKVLQDGGLKEEHQNNPSRSLWGSNWTSKMCTITLS